MLRTELENAFVVKQIQGLVLTRLVSLGAMVFSSTLQAFQGVEIEEIVVTAQKRNQNLQDVGISVTAFSSERLKQLGFTDAVDLVSHTPGLNVARPGAGSINAFSIRGVTQNDFAPVHEAPVAVYIDEAYISQTLVSNISLFDLQRAEILRGPQGTLFGRNATGGLLHFVTVKPSQETEGALELQIGEAGRRRLEVAAGGGIYDGMSIRLAAVVNQSHGLMENRIGRDGQAADDFAVRMQLLAEPSDEFSFLIKAAHAKDNSDRGNYNHRVAADGVFLPPPATDFFGYRDLDGDDPWEGAWDFNGFKFTEVNQLTATLSWQPQAFTLVSVSDYQSINNRYGEDSDVSPNSIFHFTERHHVEQWSQELRVSWEGDHYRGLVGAYYLKIDGDYGQASLVFGQEDMDWSMLLFGIAEPQGYQLRADDTQSTETGALFTQWDWDLTDSLRLTLGTRWTHDRKSYRFHQAWSAVEGLFVLFENATGPEIPYVRFRDSSSDGDWSGKLQLDYKANPDWLWYGGINRGIKSGGFNAPVDATGLLAVNGRGQFIPFTQNDALMQYDSEVLVAYELGFKSTVFGGRTRINGAAFYYDYDNYQVYNLQGLTQFVFNAKGSLQGAEIEVATSPWQGLDVQMGIAFLDTEVEDLPTQVQTDGKGEAVLAPSWTFNGRVRYTWPALGGTLAAQLDYHWLDDHIFNLSDTPVIRETAYGVLNASVTYTNDGDTTYGTIFIKNIFDKEYRQYAFDVSSEGGFGSTEDVSGLERWLGLTLGYRW